jgi:hypothetical protein
MFGGGRDRGRGVIDVAVKFREGLGLEAVITCTSLHVNIILFTLSLLSRLWLFLS